MRLLFDYVNLNKICGKKVICFGCFVDAEEFALRLMAQDIVIDYFLFFGEDRYCLPTLMNKQIIGMKQLHELDDYVVVASYKDFNNAYQVLKEVKLEENLVKIEIIQHELINCPDIIIYGTGGRAKRVFKDTDGYLNIKCFCDSNKSKAGTSFLNKPVIHSSELQGYSKDACIIIGSTYYKEIRENILQYGIDEKSIFYIDYDFTIFQSDYKKYTYKLKSLIDLLRDCRNKKIIMYGEKEIVQIMSKKLSYFEIRCNKLIERNENEEDGTIYSLAYYDKKDTICILVDNYSEMSHETLENIGFKELQYVWLESYSSFWVENYYGRFSNKSNNHKKKAQCVLDPHLGHAYINDYDSYPGFIKYEYTGKENQKNIVILTLGGSTTTGYGIRQKSWSECLSEILTEQSINHTIYCGGIDSYTVCQELVKFIRDGIWIKPDIVISYSGVNNMAIDSKTPFVHYYQKELYDSLSNSVISSNWGQMRSVNYGVEPNCDNFEFWFTHVKMMNALCESFGITFKAFLQPLLYNKAKMSKTDLDIAVLDYFLWDVSNNCLVSFEENKEFISKHKLIYKNALKFRNYAKDVNEPWFCDLSDVFDDERNIYMDLCHVYEKGNKILASRIFRELESEIDII